MLLLLLGLVLTAVSVGLLARLLVLDRPLPGRALRQIAAYSYEAKTVSATDSRPLTGRVDSLAALVGDFVASRMKRFHEDSLRRELQAAGLYTMSARKFMGYRLLSTIALPAIWLWFGSTTGAGPLRFLVGFLFGIALGWQGPMIIV